MASPPDDFESASERAPILQNFLPWELRKDNGRGADRSPAERVAVFYHWVSKMMNIVNHFELPAATVWVAQVVEGNGIKSVWMLHKALRPGGKDQGPNWSDWKKIIQVPEVPPVIEVFYAAAIPGDQPGGPKAEVVAVPPQPRVPATTRVEKMGLADQGYLESLIDNIKFELKSLSKNAERVSMESEVDPYKLLMMNMVSQQSGKGGPRGLNLYPGLSNHLAESRRIEREKQNQRLKDAQLDGLFEEIVPDPELLRLLDELYGSGQSHPAVSINDKVTLWDERRYESDAYVSPEWSSEMDAESKARQPKKGEAFGLAHHLQKLHQFLLALRVRGTLSEVDSANAMGIVLKVYREEPNKEVGLHYMQALLDYLHKSSVHNDKKSLSFYLKEPHKKTVEKLQKVYPSGKTSQGSSSDKGKGKQQSQQLQQQLQSLTAQVKNLKGLGKGGQGYGKDWGSQNRGRPFEKGDSGGSYDRSRSDFPGRKGSQGGGKPQDSRSVLSHAKPILKAAFGAAKETKDMCPFAQIGVCKFNPCKLMHMCGLCGAHNHVAIKCPKQDTPEIMKKFGL